MLIEEEPKMVGEINPDALEAVFDEEIILEEDVIVFNKNDDEESDELDIAFRDDDEDW